jgi:hypothetical protein
MTLEKVVGKVGMSMEDMPAMMGKFNTAMTELSDPSSKTAQALAKIGLSAQSFQGKSYYEGLKTLAKGMGEASNATDKMTAAQAVFGARKGNLMMPVMKEGAFAKAEAQAVPAAKMYQEYGMVFAQFQNAVGRLSLTLQPFFAGMASEIVPKLLDAVDGFQKIDLTNAGKSFGEAISGAAIVLKEAVGFVLSAVAKVESVIGKGIVTGAAKDVASQQLFGPLLDVFRLINGMTGKGGVESPAGKVAEATKAAAEVVKPNEPTINTGTPKAEGMPALIASSFTKIGAGGEAWGTRSGDAMMGIQREQLAVQQRMANALERQLANERQTGMGYEATTTPFLGD